MPVDAAHHGAAVAERELEPHVRVVAHVERAGGARRRGLGLARTRREHQGQREAPLAGPRFRHLRGAQERVRRGRLRREHERGAHHDGDRRGGGHRRAPVPRTRAAAGRDGLRAQAPHRAVHQHVHALRGVEALHVHHGTDPAVVGGLFVVVAFVGHAVAPVAPSSATPCFRSMHAAIIARARCNLFFTASMLAPTSLAMVATGASSR